MSEKGVVKVGGLVILSVLGIIGLLAALLQRV